MRATEEMAFPRSSALGGMPRRITMQTKDGHRNRLVKHQSSSFLHLMISSIARNSALSHTKSTVSTRAIGCAIKAVISQYCGGEYGGEY